MNRVQRWLAPVHRWISLLAAVYLLVIALSGSALLFRIDLQRALDPVLFQPLSEGPLAEPVAVLESLRRAYPGAEIAGFDTPTNRRPTTLAYVSTDLRFRTVLLDPASAQVLGELPRRELIRILNALHFDLTLGRTGRTINGIGGLVLAFVGLTGIILWWRGRRRWRDGLVVRRGQTTAVTHRELHSAAGIWSSIALLVWGITGASFFFPEPFVKAIEWFSPVESAEPPKVQIREGAQQAPIAAQLAAAQRAQPDLHIARVVLPGHGSVPLQVLFARSSPTRIGEPLVSVFVDPWQAEVIGSNSGRSAGEVVWSSFTMLHTGSFGGYGIRVLWLLFGLMPLLLMITGFVTWWLRRRQIALVRASRAQATGGS